MATVLTKPALAEAIRLARAKRGLSWVKIAESIGKDPVWTVAALLGQHPMTAGDASTVAALLGLDDEAVAVLQLMPYRGSDATMTTDPTIYRFHEALTVYGPAIKELIHEEFGDGIMSAINFQLSVQRRPHPEGDRVVVTFDGKFLDYAWKHSAQEVL
ncbi:MULTISPECIES: cyanase [unclassified Mycobacterium]|uniref:cyanase n=1 Tax=unclassified Mycobacterium TaxID=2642494 RepID=UPI0007FE3A67|nr:MULTISPECIES: cyanase [unclassified Mycobacterium]OBG60463.1 cyanase [Mycobacterium sp. E188]OBG62445.1 cyanase [Mycobacterium sp. E735]OBG93055.1 cyanase [Mycobacterium sp. E3298]OBH25679.1 cyanase [Mycobacterium sp. E1715]OBH40025.1 cyanase [Mycobacterium sp. E183]